MIYQIAEVCAEHERERVAELVAALKEIAKQKLAVEMDEAGGDDWEAGYEGCVKRARAALAAAGHAP